MTVDSTHRYRVVVDAATGRTLLRRNLVQHATANIHRNYPGATHGGSQEPLVTFEAGWIAPGATTLTGPNVHAFADIVDNDVAGAGEEIAPTDTGDLELLAHDELRTRRSPTAGAAPAGACSATFVCTWDPSTTTSAAAHEPAQNKGQNTAQVFFFVNKFHDHLEAAPIGFTNAESGELRGRRPGARSTRSTARRRTTTFRTQTTSTTPTWPRRPTARARSCRCSSGT